MMILIIQFCPAVCNFPSLNSIYSPQHLIFKHLNLCSSLRVRDQVSHPYKTRGKLQSLFILIVKFLDRNAKDSEIIGTKYSLNISS
jgi:hypothetical protein